MGQTTSNIAKKVSSWTGGAGDGASLSDHPDVQCLARAQINPFVHHRQSHKYIDADGDVAHEFYVQERISYKTPNSRKHKSKIVMKKVPVDQLKPVGNVKLSHPAINVDYPLVLCESSQIGK